MLAFYVAMFAPQTFEKNNFNKTFITYNKLSEKIIDSIDSILYYALTYSKRIFLIQV